MDLAAKTFLLNEKEYEIPSSFHFIGEGNLFKVPFDSVRLGNFELKPGVFVPQPRRLVADANFQGLGLSPDEIAQIAESIRVKGLDYPLQCRYKLDGDEICCEILDGDRRWNGIKLLRETNAKCWDRETESYRPAQELYENIPTRLSVIGDADVWKVMNEVQNSTKPWGDGVPVVFVKICRENGLSDDEILSKTGNGAQWLRDMDDLCNLDEVTFGYLARGQINMRTARRILGIKDIGERHAWLKESYGLAELEKEKEIKKLDRQIESTETRIETKEAEIALAEESGASEERLAELRSELADLEEKQKTKRGARKSAQSKPPQTRARHVRQVAKKRAEEAAEAAAENDEAPEIPEAVAEVAEDVLALSAVKIRRQLEAIEHLIDSENEEYCPISTLKVVHACYRSILNGEENILDVLGRVKRANAILERRK